MFYKIYLYYTSRDSSNCHLVTFIKIDQEQQSNRDKPTLINSFTYSGIKWPTCGKINVQNAKRCVQKEMARWNQLPVNNSQSDWSSKKTCFTDFFFFFLQALKSWMFHVKFISLSREGTAEFYTYQVLWSIPTPMYPEPYVTVSVFFYIVASRVQPPYFPVDVSLLCIFSAPSPRTDARARARASTTRRREQAGLGHIGNRFKMYSIMVRSQYDINI